VEERGCWITKLGMRNGVQIRIKYEVMKLLMDVGSRDGKEEFLSL
jgi:hypothetical protein